MKAYIELFMLIASLILTTVTVNAQSPSPASIRDAVKERVNDELSQVRQAVAKKAYIGSISSIDNLNLAIASIKNQSRSAVVTAATSIRLSGGREGTPADLKIGDWVIAMGTADSNGLLNAQRLLVINAPDADRRASVFLTVSQVSGTIITGANPAGVPWTVRYNRASDVSSGDKIIAAGSITADTAITASVVKVLD